MNPLLKEKKVVNNLDPKKNPYTNRFGYAFIFVTLILTIIAVIKTEYVEVEWYHPLVTLFIGLGLIISPDRLFSELGVIINKIIDFKVR